MYSILQALREFYSREGAEPGPYLEVAFDRDEVALEVEEDGVTLDNGWSLVPLFCPTSVRYVLYSIYMYCILYPAIVCIECVKVDVCPL